jgi:bifunctional enzyme CysN/CysC
MYDEMRSLGGGVQRAPLFVAPVPGPERGATVWLTGLPAAGKTTIGRHLERELRRRGRPAYRLDGDVLRTGLNSDLGFDMSARHENVRRVAEVAALFADAGLIAIVSVVSPYEAARAEARAVHARLDLDFHLVWVDTPMTECERRDPKSLYRRARAGALQGMTGVDAPYECPAAPALRLDGRGSPALSAAAIIELL